MFRVQNRARADALAQILSPLKGLESLGGAVNPRRPWPEGQGYQAGASTGPREGARATLAKVAAEEHMLEAEIFLS